MIFPDDIAVVHLSHVPQQRMRSGARCDGNPLNVRDRGHLRLGNLHLDLVSDTGFRVGPVVRNNKPARRRCGQEGTATLAAVTPSCPARSRSMLTSTLG